MNNKLGGPVAWMTRNHVAANLLMGIFILGGLIVAVGVKQEVFPEFVSERVSIEISYPGASPEEVEQGIILSIEDSIQGLDGVKSTLSNAFEGRAQVTASLLNGADSSKALQDIKNAVDRIQTFPEDAERPIVSLIEARNQVLSVMVYGNQQEYRLREIAEQIRDGLLQKKGITLVTLGAKRPFEIAIEIPQEQLRRYNLTLTDVSNKVRAFALELPGGGIKTKGGEILLRTQERKDYAQEYMDIPIVVDSSGSVIYLKDIATIRDQFSETDEEASYDSKPAIEVQVFRVGNETPQSISKITNSYVKEIRTHLPESVKLAIWNDRSEVYQDRMFLLLKNAGIGLILVLMLLGLFLDPRLAFWVTLGIPISVLGSFLFIPFTGASINMISLFAFIVTLGIIVDDAVIVGENVYEKRQQGLPFMEAAILGAKGMTLPVIFAVLTNIAAFLPLFFVPGDSGNLFKQIPAIVVSVFIVSLIESLFVLPAHLSHKDKPNVFWFVLGIPSKIFSKVMTFFADKVHARVVRVCVNQRYTTLSIAIAIFVLSVSLVIGGRIPFTFMPKISSDRVTAQVLMPFGIAVEDSRKIKEILIEKAHQVIAENGGEKIKRGIYAKIGSSIGGFSPGVQKGGATGSHIVGVQIYLVTASKREISSQDFARKWRELTLNLPNVQSINFDSSIGNGSGAAIQIELSHRSREILETAAQELANIVSTYNGAKDIDDGVSQGKPQIDFKIRKEASSLNLTANDIATQIRGAFFGLESLRQQRGRNEVKVMVRLPLEERSTYHTLEQMILRTPSRLEVPLMEVAKLNYSYAYTEINRRDGRRIISITGDVDNKQGNSNNIMSEIIANDIPRLQSKYQGLTYSLEGEQASQRESLEFLQIGFIFALMVIYALLAISFASYFQPFLVMFCIPFGIIGAIWGHVILGFGLSLISMFGLIALTGVVVNDSLVLIVAANEFRYQQKLSAKDSIIQASVRRLRPILLTSLTTFFGLAPMILETSVQARFLIPMAISLGFGILFATFIVLLVLPALYIILEDLVFIFSSILRFWRYENAPQPKEKLEGLAAVQKSESELFQ
ncbi:efflux RND transporter permease subunit [Candidatus Uabimicrobium sp. HlEnr_7]|uniref:efflux RND transporter permease subunit n=1 Tax=Candidatus Uabimicrobium helgolandensis TaxID=3095367 RepID=UPI003557FDA4